MRGVVDLISVSNEVFDHLAAFQGCGNPDGNYWFIGLEEGVKGGKGIDYEASLEREIEIRAGWRELEDLHQMRRSIGETMKTGPWTWRVMASIALSLGGDDGWDRPASYMQERLGRPGGETFMTELFPLPTKEHDEKLWPFNAPYISRKSYEVAVREPRENLIHNLWARHSPAYVFCYGKGDWEAFERLYPGTYATFPFYNQDDPTKLTHAVKVARVAGSLAVLTYHFSVISGYTQISQIVESVNRYKSDWE
jgi:hypothetical protein